MRIDLKAAGFVVTDVPAGSRVTASGRLRQEGDEAVIVATGAKFE